MECNRYFTRQQSGKVICWQNFFSNSNGTCVGAYWTFNNIFSKTACYYPFIVSDDISNIFLAEELINERIFMESEHNIQKEIQVALSQHKCSVFRTNVGKVQTIDHRWFDTGLPQGFPDLMGFRWVDNQIFFIEVKTETGKPRPDQIRFHEFLQSHNVIHGIARNEKDALMIVDGGLIGYGYD